MPDANLLFEASFTGTLGAEWTSFVWPDGNPSAAQPILNGKGAGIGSQVLAPGTTKPWRAKCIFYPGRHDHKVDAVYKWKDPYNQGRREAGTIVRMIDYDNCMVVRVRSMLGSAPEVRLFTVIAGAETQIGATYTGALASSLDLYSGLTLRVATDDNVDGTIRVRVFVDPTPDDNGDLVMERTVDEPILRGKFTAGVELRDLTLGNDVNVSAFRCYDFADEWTTTSGTPDPTNGWFVELGSTLYDMDALAALSPKIQLVDVTKGYGSNGNSARLRVDGDFRLGTILFPGQTCRVIYQGVVLFNGWVDEAEQSAAIGSESQVFTCRDATWAAVNVNLLEDDLTGQHFFNVFDEESDDYDSSRQDMTIGEIVQWLFDRYADDDYGLRYHGACTVGGTPYVGSELAGMTAVIPDVTVSGNFLNAIESLRKYQVNYQFWVDPTDKRWHFYDVTALPALDVNLLSRTVPSIKIKPDRSKSVTAIEWLGAKKQNADTVTMYLSDGTAKPAWTKRQADNWRKDKEKIRRWVFTADSYGTASSGEFKNYVYLGISAPEIARIGLEDDDMRGGVITVNGWTVWVIGNFGGKIYLGATAFASTPTLPAQFVVSLNKTDGAIEAMTAAGVGRAFVVRPGVACSGTAIASEVYKNNLKNKGFCGKAVVVSKDDKDREHAQEYDYRAAMMTQEAYNVFGICDPMVMLSQPVKPPVGYINKLPNPGGSPPASGCSGTNNYPSGKLPEVDVEFELSMHKTTAAYKRVPAVGFRGRAYSDDETTWDGGGKPYGQDWRVERCVQISDPDFVDEALQGSGFEEAANSLLKVFGEKAWSFDLDIVTPWEPVEPAGARYDLSYLVSLQQRITLQSPKRATGFESNEILPIASITYGVESCVTRVSAGTVLAWTNLDLQTVAKTVLDRNTLRRQVKMIKELEDFRNQLIKKAANRVGGSTGGSIDACEIHYTNEIIKESKDLKTVVIDKDNKIHNLSLIDQVMQRITVGVDTDHAGAPIEVPGLTGGGAAQVVDGPVLRNRLNPRTFDQGPPLGANADRGRYGGNTRADDADDTLIGRPPATLLKIGSFAFRSSEDRNGSVYGGGDLEYSPLDVDGNPTAWSTFAKGSDLPDGHVPLNFASHGSLIDTILKRIRETERVLGQLEDTVSEELLQAGNKPSAYPDGVPATVLDLALALVGSSNVQVLLNTLNDKGGPVVMGPLSLPTGANAQAFWRLAMPERVLYEVERVSPGAGENGGRWAPVTVGGARVYMDTGRILHKQEHGAGIDGDNRYSDSGERSLDGSPYGFDNSAGLRLSAAGQSGVGASFDIPRGARGVPGLFAVVGEPDGIAVAGGLDVSVWISYSYRASAWSASADTTPAVALTTDGAGTAVGIYKSPGGAVPPGLRKIALSVVRDPAAGADTSTAPAEVSGVGIEVAVIDGGYWLRATEALDVLDVVDHNHPCANETVSMAEAVRMVVEKTLSEPIGVTDNVEVVVNPPLAIDELVPVEDVAAFTVTKALSEATAVADSVSTELNP